MCLYFLTNSLSSLICDKLLYSKMSEIQKKEINLYYEKFAEIHKTSNNILRCLLKLI